MHYADFIWTLLMALQKQHNLITKYMLFKGQKKGDKYYHEMISEESNDISPLYIEPVELKEPRDPASTVVSTMVMLLKQEEKN